MRITTLSGNVHVTKIRSKVEFEKVSDKRWYLKFTDRQGQTWKFPVKHIQNLKGGGIVMK